MRLVRAVVPAVTLILLLFAAVDLLASDSCDDGRLVDVGTAAAFDDGRDDGPASHPGDDCYCCSRTVQAEATARLVPAIEAGLVFEARQPSLLQVPSFPPYHPPLI